MSTKLIMHFRHPRIVGSLFSLLLLLILPEAFLQIADPWKVRNYFGDLSALFSHFAPDVARGVVLTPGDDTFSTWSAHVNADGNRAVPATTQSACRIAFVGDSVTFGFGVSDEDTWINQLAPHFPKTTLLNTGIPGYNAAQAAATVQAVPVSGYLYLMVNNDADKPIAYEAPETAPKSLYTPILETYLYIYDTRVKGASYTVPDYAAFDKAVTFLKAQPNVSIVGFTGDTVALRAGVPMIGYWLPTEANSFSDGHANTAGNARIAREIEPYMSALVDKVCP